MTGCLNEISPFSPGAASHIIVCGVGLCLFTELTVGVVSGSAELSAVVPVTMFSDPFFPVGVIALVIRLFF